MSSERIFAWILCGIYTFFSILRLIYGRITHQDQLMIEQFEKKQDKIILNLLVLYEMITFIGYVIWTLVAPNSVPFSVIIPTVFRWIGSVIGIISLIFFIWIHKTLGHNFSRYARIQINQELITNGPYCLVRHPMYLAFIILHISVYLISSNFFITITWTLALSAQLIRRIPEEENMLSIKFGNRYQLYKDNTPLLIPKPNNFKNFKRKKKS